MGGRRKRDLAGGLVITPAAPLGAALALHARRGRRPCRYSRLFYGTDSCWNSTSATLRPLTRPHCSPCSCTYSRATPLKLFYRQSRCSCIINTFADDARVSNYIPSVFY
ncbi:hypothetical protein EVAR_79363_1 [Eumeta japonica]|uniref:Uncharacterized protein n=1 Tax=Eumeta variegata TaxID=151549 RepID=A0A4C1TFW4_EUMVA|nr:hypothetical protein EVAR_79363_1 [Eumeta japonica]